MDVTKAEVVRECFESYVRQDRDTAERLIGEPFVFTSPQDDHIDRATYFERCFPTMDRLRRHEVLHVTPTVGDDVFVLYEYELEHRRGVPKYGGPDCARWAGHGGAGLLRRSCRRLTPQKALRAGRADPANSPRRATTTAADGGTSPLPGSRARNRRAGATEFQHGPSSVEKPLMNSPWWRGPVGISLSGISVKRIQW